MMFFFYKIQKNLASIEKQKYDISKINHSLILGIKSYLHFDLILIYNHVQQIKNNKSMNGFSLILNYQINTDTLNQISIDDITG